MPAYPLNNLGSIEFERLSQSLLKSVIGAGTITFGAGPDGAREATFDGEAPYPSPTERWNGHWIFQVKFHDIDLLGTDGARKQIINDLDAELDKVVNKYKYDCSNFIMITNVPLTGVSKRGTLDRLFREVAVKYRSKVRNVHVWGADDVSRLLEQYPAVRQSYLHFLTPGDIIQQILDTNVLSRDRLAEAVRLYLVSTFSREQYAQLVQAGETSDDRMPLQKVFIDLEVTVHDRFYASRNVELRPGESDAFFYPFDRRSSALSILLGEERAVVLIGGPGQGKSTISQYLAQIHRATLLNRLRQLTDKPEELLPLVPRIPFRVILKEYAQWLSDHSEMDNLEIYPAERVASASAKDITSDDIHQVLRLNSCLLIFDGLDEVMDREVRSRMLDRIGEFLEKCHSIFESDLQVVATSRPTGYTNQFDPKQFLHLTLVNLSRSKVDDYIAKWCRANQLDEERKLFLTSIVKEYLDDSQIGLLMNTPLQVTILVLIILSGGTPPRQREALFNEYLELIYKREKSKAKWIIRTDKELLFGLHQYIGYTIHSRAEKQKDSRDALREEDFIAAVKAYFVAHDDTLSGPTVESQVEQLVTEARDRLVLIVELSPGLFGFELRSILEFFAAGHLNDTARNSLQRAERFTAIAPDDRWRNVALFFAGRLARHNRGEASAILQVCSDVDAQIPDKYLRRGAWLAIDLAVDRSFGHQRNLQRSAISYSLTLLDSRQSAVAQQSLATNLTRLPAEDITSFVKPELQQRLSTFAISHLGPIVQTYIQLFRYDDYILNLADRYLRSDSRSEVYWIAKLAIDLTFPGTWLSPRLNAMFSQLTLHELKSMLVPHLRGAPQYMSDVLSQVKLSEQQARGLLDAVFEQPWWPTDRRSDLRLLDWIAIEGITPQAQLWRSLSFFFLIGRVKSSVEHRYPYSEAPISFLVHRWRQRSVLDYLDEGESRAIENLDLVGIVNDERLYPHIRASAWALRLIVERDSAPTLSEFSSYFRTEMSRVHWLKDFFNQWLSRVDSSLLFLVLDSNAICEASQANLSGFAALRSIGDEWLPELALLDKSMPKIKSEEGREYLQIVTRSYLLLPTIPTVDIESNLWAETVLKLLNTDSDAFTRWAGSELFYHVMSLEPSPLQKKEINDVLKLTDAELAKGQFNEDVLTRLERLVQFEWSLDPSTIDVILSALNRLTSLAPDRQEQITTILSEIALRLLNQSHPHDEAMSKVLGVINRFGFGQKRHSFSYIHIRNNDRILRNLSRFLTGTTDSVRNGAIKIITALTEALSGFYSVGEDDFRAHIPAKGGYWTSELSKRLIERENRRIEGIRLLTWSKISRDQDMVWIAKAIAQCQSEEEAEAWALFFRLVVIRLSGRSIGRWTGLIEKFIESDEAISPIIKNAMFARYAHLIKSRPSELITREGELGLPLDLGN